MKKKQVLRDNTVGFKGLTGLRIFEVELEVDAPALKETFNHTWTEFQ